MSRKLLILAPLREKDVNRIKGILPSDFTLVHAPEAITKEAIKKELYDAEFVIGQPPVSLLINPEKTCPKLKMIQMTWAGADMYTAGVMKFPAGKIILANASGAYGMIMSQFVIGMILSVMLNFKTYHNQQQQKIWERKGPIQSLDHAKVLIFGAGDIGRATAKRLSGFDAYCIGVCRNTGNNREYFNELCTLDEAEKYIPQADVIVGCLPNTVETAGYMNERRIGLMQEGSVIVNVGRGNFIDCMALDEALRNEKLWGAALDVTYPEPLPNNHPLWNNERCMITPHTSGTTFGHLSATEDLLCDILCNNFMSYYNGEDVINRVY